MKAKISEIFKSIQGEGPYQGVAQIFVRFFGCPLNCSFCDTVLDTYEEVSLESLIERIFSYQQYHSISLTGGEPLLQIDFLKELAYILKKQGKVVYLETNGTLYNSLIKVIDYIDIISMDFKLPSSTGMRSFWDEHREFLKVGAGKDIFIKAVVGKDTREEDIFKAIDVIAGAGSFVPLCKNIRFILQPQNPYEFLLGEKIKLFEDICRQRGINVMVKPQLHKQLQIR